MSPRVTRINLIGVAIFSAVLILYAVTQLLQAFVLDDTYPLFAELPRAAGLRENKEVTYNGHPVGTVRAVTATDRGARVEMAIEPDAKIPVEVDVVVLRRSPIGEQALDIRPVGPAAGSASAGDDIVLVAGEFYESGDTIDIRNLTLPPDVQELFETVVRVLAPVDAENTGALVSELADTVRGRRDDIRSIMRDSADLSEAIADEGGEYDRLFASSRTVNAELAEHRETLAGLFTDLRRATTVLSDGRDEFEQLLVTAPPVLVELGDFVEQAQPNIACGIRDFANLNETVAQPRILDSGAEALRNNRLFFEGTEGTTAFDPDGYNWFRVHVEGEQQGPPPDSYLPDKRPVKTVLPGGACSSPFGPGAPSATQAGFKLRVPDASIKRPGNDRTDRRVGSEDGDEENQAVAASSSTPPQRSLPATVQPAGALPATGGDPLPLLVFGLLTVGSGIALVRRGTIDD
jgi:virulence factor Mce-like protein